MLKLGIDVGGTNTDATILNDKDQVIATVKTHTTADIETGIYDAIKKVLLDFSIDPTEISQAMLGTTQATNAIVERKNLATVGVIRIGYPATASVMPYTEWPQDMIAALTGKAALVHGGYEFNGDPIANFDPAEIYDILNSWKGKIESLAIIGVFSALNDDQEQKTAQLAKKVLGADIPISLSSRIGTIGLIQRENATILNAALVKVIKRVTKGFAAALADYGITQATSYLCQNDGTLMSLEFATKYPILTIGSGPTNSIRGAAYLSNLQDAMVLDIGGTTSDIGVLTNGFPRESSRAITVGGIKTSFRMPDVLSIGLGGGSVIHKDAQGKITVGPDSVGYKITDEAICFGGQTITATDIAVKLLGVKLGNPQLTEQIDDDLAKKAMAIIQARLSDAIDQMKTNAGKVDLILVGGGSIIVASALAGVAKIYSNKYGKVANAIGATIAQVGGQYEKIYQYANLDRRIALADAAELAKKQAIVAGADPKTIKIIEVNEVPLAYAPGETTRVKVKVVGELA
ncbi:hydantoinase/oxoprolinase N-terminal domain-containing protein [Liquorilactobacillus nagelii]|uniref:hydantoinase/oxoprolinase N-terminal domain-containing protein n=1 Tax=Liquorilactobacillus nagelii TaxID=82688 RepID=UPI0039EA8D57